MNTVCAKNYKSWLAVDKSIAIIIRLIFGPSCIIQVALTVSLLSDFEVFEPPTLFASLLSLGLIVMISSGGSHQFLYNESGNKNK